MTNGEISPVARTTVSARLPSKEIDMKRYPCCCGDECDCGGGGCCYA